MPIRNLFQPLALLVAMMPLSQAAMAQRGSSGHVNVIYWQAPSILNPIWALHFFPIWTMYLKGFPCSSRASKGGVPTWLL